MGTKGRLVVNTEDQIVSEAFDDEAIIMRLSDGAYFSIDTIGSLVWRKIQQGTTVTEIVRAVVRHYDVSPKDAERDIEHLVEELVRERLISISKDRYQPQAEADQAIFEKHPYKSPKLEVYNDMQDLLALDPPFGPDCKCGANS